MTELAPCERQVLSTYKLESALAQRAVAGEQLTSAELIELAALVATTGPTGYILADAIQFRARTGLEDPECGK